MGQRPRRPSESLGRGSLRPPSRRDSPMSWHRRGATRPAQSAGTWTQRVCAPSASSLCAQGAVTVRGATTRCGGGWCRTRGGGGVSPSCLCRPPPTSRRLRRGGTWLRRIAAPRVPVPLRRKGRPLGRRGRPTSGVGNVRPPRGPLPPTPKGSRRLSRPSDPRRRLGRATWRGTEVRVPSGPRQPGGSNPSPPQSRRSSRRGAPRNSRRRLCRLSRTPRRSSPRKDITTPGERPVAGRTYRAADPRPRLHRPPWSRRPTAKGRLPPDPLALTLLR